MENRSKYIAPSVQSYDRDELQKTTIVYRRRWYVLFVFCIIAAMENVLWNTWGPISRSARFALDWDHTVIDLLANWGAVTFLIFVFPSSWLLDTYGLRWGVLLCVMSELIGSLLRIITLDSTAGLYLVHTAHIIIGIGGPVAQSASTLISSTWFPSGQRTTATAVSSLAVYIGTALSFIIGPAIVPQQEILSQYNISTMSDCIQVAQNHSIINCTTLHHDVKKSIQTLMYSGVGISAVLALLVLLYFPAKPPQPPSISASTGRYSYTQGLKTLIRNPQFQLIAFLYGITSGVYSAWCSVLTPNLEQFNLSAKFANFLGTLAVGAGAVSGITLSYISDRFVGIMKLLVMGLFVFATAAFSVFSLLCIGVVPQQKYLFYLTCIVGGFCVNGVIPLFFELSVEASYPVAEGINTGFMTFSNNFYCMVFLLVGLVPSIGSAWMNWTLVGSCAICVPLLVLFQEVHRRLEQDKKGYESLSIESNSVSPLA